jgi:hypothetical protein
MRVGALPVRLDGQGAEGTAAGLAGSCADDIAGPAADRHVGEARAMHALGFVTLLFRPNEAGAPNDVGGTILLGKCPRWP